MADDLFQQRAVAFVDVLGFKDLISKVENDSSKRGPFFSLFTVLDNHARFSNQALSASVPDAVRPKYLFISDSIIFSVPLSHRTDEGKTYDGLSIVVAKSIEISHKLLQMGFLVRGAISVGPVWHTDRNIFGSGYIEAWQLEQSAGGPRILLSPAAMGHWEKVFHASFPTTMCIPDGPDLIVDTLHPEYVAGTDIHGKLEGDFQQYRAWITTRLDDLTPGSSPWKKWNWMKNAYNNALVRYGIGATSI
jgi:hypothetical protein